MNDLNIFRHSVFSVILTLVFSVTVESVVASTVVDTLDHSENAHTDISHGHDKHSRWKRSVRLKRAHDVNPDPHIFETTLIAAEHTLSISSSNETTVFAYNDSVPGPLIQVNLGDRVIVHLKNELPAEWNTSIHWHGIEGNNAADGTQVTQLAVQSGDTYTYDFIVSRAGTFWYHPHLRSTQAVFAGLYGALIVKSPEEKSLVKMGVLPRREAVLVLSDISVNDEDEVVDLETGGLSDLEVMNGTEGEVLLVNGVELPTIKLRRGEGVRLRLINASVSRYYRLSLPGHRMVRYGGEGGLLNEAILEGGSTMGMVMDMPMKMCDSSADCAANGSAYSMCMDMAGSMMKVCGGMELSESGFDEGEIVLAPAERVNVVIVPNADAGKELFLEWKDFARGRHEMNMEMPMHMCMTSDNCTNPEYPTCMRMNMPMGGGMEDEMEDDMSSMGMGKMTMCGAMNNASDDGERASKKILRIIVKKPRRRHHDNPFIFEPGTPLLEMTGTSVEVLGDVDVDFSGMMNRMNLQGSMDETGNHFMIDGVSWHPMWGATELPEVAPTARYANLGDVIKFEVHNHTEMYHPFHLHGFSFQPIEFMEMHHDTGTMKRWAYGPDEFVDTVSIPPHTSMIAKVRLDDPVGNDLAAGRWLFHCHIFQHGAGGMMSELITLPAGEMLPENMGIGAGGMDM